MPATEDFSRNHIICDSLMSGCNAAEILRLMRTSKAFEVMARDFLRRAYNVHKPLRRFFQDPIAFRAMQYETGAVVSGSFALQFFVRSYYPTADLDLYVTHPGAEKVGSWLQENGFTYVPAIKKRRGKVLKQPRSFKDAISSLDLAWVPDEFYCKGVMGVLNFEGVVGGNRRKVQLIMTDLCPIRTILNFYSTCIMNFITYEKAYCLYPRETIDKSISLVTTEYTTESYMAMKKYNRRGFKFYDVVDEEERDFKYKEVRWVEDDWSWVISLEDVGIGRGVLDPTRLTTWSIMTVPSEHHRVHVKEMYGEKKDAFYPIMVATTVLKSNIKQATTDLKDRGLIVSTDPTSKERNTTILFHKVYEILITKKW